MIDIIAADNYIHYYERDSQEILRDIKIGMTTQWYSGTNEENIKKYNQRTHDLNKDLNLNFTQIEQELQRIFNPEQLDSVDINMSGYTIQKPVSEGGYSLNSASKDFARLLKNNVEKMKLYLDYMQEIIQKIDLVHEKLGLPSLYALIQDESIKTDVDVAQALENLNNSLVRINPQIINGLDKNYATLIQSLLKMQQFAHGQRQLSGTATQQTQEIQTWLKGISGAVKGIKGSLLEAELGIGFLKGNDEVFQAIMTGHVNSDIVKEIIDPQLQKDTANASRLIQEIINAGKLRHNNPLADITLQIGVDGGYAYTGLSIKNTSNKITDIPVEKKWDFTKTLGIGSKSNLYDQITNPSIRGQLQILTQVDPVYYGQQAFGVHGDSKSTPTGNYWEQFIDAVAVLNVLDRLVGEGGFGNFANYLIINHQVVSMSKILNEVAKHPDRVYGYSLDQRIGRGINKWVNQPGEDKTSNAEIRSESFRGSAIYEFQKASLSTKIDLSLLSFLNS